MSICFFYDDWKTFLSYYTLPSSNLSYWKFLEKEKKNVGHFLYANLTAADLGENWKLRKISCNVSKRRSHNSGEDQAYFFLSGSLLFFSQLNHTHSVVSGWCYSPVWFIRKSKWIFLSEFLQWTFTDRNILEDSY